MSEKWSRKETLARASAHSATVAVCVPVGSSALPSLNGVTIDEVDSLHLTFGYLADKSDSRSRCARRPQREIGHIVVVRNKAAAACRRTKLLPIQCQCKSKCLCQHVGTCV